MLQLNLGIPGSWINPSDNTLNSTLDDIVHIVKKGETLSGIAKKYSVTVDYLVKKNHIGNPNLIYVNQKIVIK